MLTSIVNDYLGPIAPSDFTKSSDQATTSIPSGGAYLVILAEDTDNYHLKIMIFRTAYSSITPSNMTYGSNPRYIVQQGSATMTYDLIWNNSPYLGIRVETSAMGGSVLTQGGFVFPKNTYDFSAYFA